MNASFIKLNRKDKISVAIPFYYTVVDCALHDLGIDPFYYSSFT